MRDPEGIQESAVIRALVVDDDLLFADLLAEEIREVLPGLVAVDVLGDPAAVIDVFKEKNPDIVFLDVVFRDSSLSGFELANSIHDIESATKIVILSAAPRTDWETTVAMGDAIRSHAVHYLTKSIRRAEFIEALTAVIEGFVDLPRIIAERLRSHAVPQPDILSRREVEVLDLASRGCTDRDIAKRLSISPKTVNDYKSNARHKFGAKTTTEAVAIATRRGLLPLK